MNPPQKRTPRLPTPMDRCFLNFILEKKSRFVEKNSVFLKLDLETLTDCSTFIRSGRCDKKQDSSLAAAQTQQTQTTVRKRRRRSNTTATTGENNSESNAENGATLSDSGSDEEIEEQICIYRHCREARSTKKVCMNFIKWRSCSNQKCKFR